MRSIGQAASALVGYGLWQARSGVQMAKVSDGESQLCAGADCSSASNEMGGMFRVMDAGAMGVLASSTDKPDISAGRVGLSLGMLTQ